MSQRPKLHAAALLSAVAILSMACVSLDPEGVDRNLEGSVESGGILRSYQVHLPPDYEGKQLPVVFVLHSGGGSSFGIRNVTSYDQYADAWGFIAAYPEGWARSWAEGCNCTEADTAGIDDVQFFSDLIDELDAELGIDRSRVYAVGYSAGGFMVQRLACDLGDKLAAVGSVAGTLSGPLSDACVPSSTIPFLMIHGTSDQVVPYEGVPDQGNFTLLSADSTAQFWATYNSCGERLPSEPYGGTPIESAEVWTESWDCAAGSEVILYRIVGGPHTWPIGPAFSASWVLADFFSKH